MWINKDKSKLVKLLVKQLSNLLLLNAINQEPRINAYHRTQIDLASILSFVTEISEDKIFIFKRNTKYFLKSIVT